MCWITCGCCGHKDDYIHFTRTPVYGDLPKDTFQCPRCHVAISRRYGTPIMYDSGFVAPGKMAIVQVEARL